MRKFTSAGLKIFIILLYFSLYANTLTLAQVSANNKPAPMAMATQPKEERE